MRKNLCLLAFAFLMALSTSTQAKVWTLCSLPEISTDFHDFDAAYQAAAAGDTIYVYGGDYAVTTSPFIIDKQICIIGNGHFSDNALDLYPPVNRTPTNFSFDITFVTNSQGSCLIGLSMINNKIWIKTSSITINKSRIKFLDLGKNQINTVAWQFSNIILTQNTISAVVTLYDNVITPTYWNIFTNCVIANNVFEYPPYAYYYAFFFGNPAFRVSYITGIFENNIFRSQPTILGSLVNNIFVNGVILMEGTYTNNISSDNTLGTANGNQANVVMTTVFTDPASDIQLKPGSPAIGAGSDGTDCGVFGGSEPYVLSGLPALPVIYNLVMPTSGNTIDGLNVTIKAKAKSN